MSDGATTGSGSKKAIKPADSCDINVSPDKRTNLLHSENNLIESLKVALTEEFDTAPSSFVLNAAQVALAQKETEVPSTGEGSSTSYTNQPSFIPDDAADAEEVEEILTGEPNSEVAAMDDDSAGPPLEQEPEDTSPPSEEPRPPVEKRPRSTSLDPVTNEETRPPKKAATACFPSPAPAFSPTTSSTASQRLAGPGRTPARVEQILSTNTSSTGRGMQMVLDATGASWNLKPGHEGPQRKCSHPADVSGSSSGKNARINMGARLAVLEVKRSSKKVVDENKDGDDEVKPQSKPKASAPVSNDADPTSSEELHDMSSASAAPTATASSSHDAVSGIQTEVAHTPLPNPECDPPRASMPEPEGGHWIFTPLIQNVIRQKAIPFWIRNTHESSDKSLQMYAKCTGRTILEKHRTVTPAEGEVILDVCKRSCLNQISVHPRFLVPWEPVVGDEVVVIKGLFLGTMGVAKAKEHTRWVVTFSADNHSWDFRFEQSDLATIEDFWVPRPPRAFLV